MSNRPFLLPRVMILLLCGATLSCNPEMAGLPRIPLSSESPDGRSVAWVRNHPTMDGPSQSLWVSSDGGPDIRLRRFSADQDWCDQIVWSADSSTVAFLVSSARLVAADRNSSAVLTETWLTARDGSYPPSRVVDGLSLSAEGELASFRDCPRRLTGSPPCQESQVSVR